MFEAIRKYLNPKILPFLGLGISVQAPINLIGGTLKYWSNDSGLNLAVIGVFGAVTMPYSLKFLWAPMIDSVHLPWAKWMGCKRAWCYLFQLGILGALFFISFLDPKLNPWALFWGCLVIGFCGASQALTVDSFKIDILNGQELTDGTTIKEVGGRLGYLGATAGMIGLAMFLPWQTAYFISMGMIFIGLISLLYTREEVTSPKKIDLDITIKKPFFDLWHKLNFPMLCLFIVLYKLCNGMLGGMAYPFYSQIGFTKQNVMLVSSIFGSIMTGLGVFYGGIFISRFNIKSLLLAFGCIEMYTSLAFAGLAMAGPSIPLFILVIIFDNIVGGIGNAIWVVFISRMCSKSFSATQYGFLDALTMVPLTLVGLSSGVLAQWMGWPIYFVFTGMLMVPALCLILYSKTLFQSCQAKN